MPSNPTPDHGYLTEPRWFTEASRIPGPGYGPLEGAVENHGTQSIGTAGRPANTWAQVFAIGAFAVVVVIIFG